ncbi:hypothetical protein [Saccharopolyspora sp. CA-218241]|uniref:hypothetical protein n=1 Tax=Saccharopolyspora sp. CA-218241 TaxID=3240027 RepID=UPI003D99A509
MQPDEQVLGALDAPSPAEVLGTAGRGRDRRDLGLPGAPDPAAVVRHPLDELGDGEHRDAAPPRRRDQCSKSIYPFIIRTCIARAATLPVRSSAKIRAKTAELWG